MALSDAVKVGGGAEASSGAAGEGLDGSVLRILTKCPLFSDMSLSDAEKPSGSVSLRRPLYPLCLQEWAKEFRSDLLRTEKSLYDMLADPQSNSCQLKPMRSWSRESVILLANYYSVNAHEYGDLQGKRYVSLVKTVDSALPSLPLSAAAMRLVQAMSTGLATAVSVTVIVMFSTHL